MKYKIFGKAVLVSDKYSWMLVSKEEFNRISKKNINSYLEKKFARNLFFKEKNSFLSKKNIEKLYNYNFSYPSLHIINLTKRCNQKCLYCHTSAKDKKYKKYDMNIKTASEILAFIFKIPLENFAIEFQGGETTLNMNVLKFIVKKARVLSKNTNKTINFCIATNLTCVKKQDIDWLIKNKIHISTSLDGPKNLHDFNRPIIDLKSSYDKLNSRIKYCRSCGYNPGALMVTTKKSLSLYKEIIDEYLLQNQTSIFLKYLLPAGFASDTRKTIGYEIKDFLSFWDKSTEYILELNKKGKFIYERSLYSIIEKVLLHSPTTNLDFRSPCGMVRGTLLYDFDGKIYTCNQAQGIPNFELGHVKSECFNDITKSDKARKLVALTDLKNYKHCRKCVYIDYCGVCILQSFFETGNCTLKNNDLNCKLRKHMFDYFFDKLINDTSAKKIFLSWILKKSGISFYMTKLNMINNTKNKLVIYLGKSSPKINKFIKRILKTFIGFNVTLISTDKKSISYFGQAQQKFPNFEDNYALYLDMNDKLTLIHPILIKFLNFELKAGFNIGFYNDHAFTNRNLNEQSIKILNNMLKKPKHL